MSAPTLAEFLAAPASTVAAVAPATMVLAAGGTRREAALQGITPQAYGGWAMDQMLAACQRIFNLGVSNLFVSIIRSTQAREAGEYGARLWSLARDTLATEQRVAWLVQAGIRVRCFGAGAVPQLADTLASVEQATAACNGPTLWWTFALTPDQPWSDALPAILNAGASTRDAAIQAIYGQALDPVGVYLGFGKPFFSAELLPPLLEGQAAAFWYQQPGYLPLTDRLLRQVFYDAAYLRTTWTADKTDRYSQIEDQRVRWSQPLLLGLGERSGGFWYPLVNQ